MKPWLLLLVSGAYVYTGITESIRDSGWWLGFWSSYAAANIFYMKATGVL